MLQDFGQTLYIVKKVLIFEDLQPKTTENPLWITALNFNFDQLKAVSKAYISRHTSIIKQFARVRS